MPFYSDDNSSSRMEFLIRPSLLAVLPASENTKGRRERPLPL